jgi:hypothetical protein
VRANSLNAKVRTKAPTSTAGFDEITVGGLPRGRTTLLAVAPERVTELHQRRACA